jgi:MscS family membrane protein
MNAFLHNRLFDNYISDYLIVFGIILLVWILKKRASKNITRLIFYVFKRMGRVIDEKEFFNLVLAPLENFILFLAVYISVGTLDAPSILHFKLFKIPVEVLIDRVSVGLLIFFFFHTLLRVIDYIAIILEKRASVTEDTTDDQLIIFFREFLKVILVIICILVMIRMVFNEDITKILAGLSLAGAAIALAAKESLENLIASFIIFFDRPFRVGDLLKVQQIQGTVEKIGLRSTRIRTNDKTYVSIPNKQMVDTVVDNFSLRNKRRGELTLFLDLKTNLNQVNQLIKELEAALSSDAITEKTVLLSDVRIEAFVITIEYFTDSIPINEFNEIKQSINLKTLQILEKLQIEIAGKNKNIGMS